MLILSRKVGDQVVIADNVWVTVLEVAGKQVRLGFAAPAEVSIWRGELEKCKPRAPALLSGKHPPNSLEGHARFAARLRRARRSRALQERS